MGEKWKLELGSESGLLLGDNHTPDYHTWLFSKGFVPFYNLSREVRYRWVLALAVSCGDNMCHVFIWSLWGTLLPAWGRC